MWTLIKYVSVHLIGNVLWQQSSSPGAGAVVPVLSVPDLDKDGTDDIALLTPQQNQVGPGGHISEIVEM